MTGSVMDYNPPNFNMEAGEVQGDFAMIGIGPYDKWAIEYGYTFGDLKEVLARVAEPELAYLTDDDTRGPDPHARRYDFSSNPLDYAENQMRLVRYHRERILDKLVKDGQSWSKARRGYQTTLSMQLRMLSMMTNWVGAAHVNRDRKGDPNGRPPVQVVSGFWSHRYGNLLTSHLEVLRHRTDKGVVQSAHLYGHPSLTECVVQADLQTEGSFSRMLRYPLELGAGRCYGILKVLAVVEG